MLTKGILINLLFVAFSSAGFGQAKATLTGTVYDSNGAVVLNTKVTATDKKGNRVTAVTNDEGVYTLDLPFCQPPLIKCRIATYQIRAEAPNFKSTVIKEYPFVPAHSKKMVLDIALEIGDVID